MAGKFNPFKDDLLGIGGDGPAYMIRTPVPEQSEHLVDVNPCVRAFGPGPTKIVEKVGALNVITKETLYRYCHQCAHLEVAVAIEDRLKPNGTEMHVLLHVCPFRTGTHAPHIYHELEWKSCARFQRRRK